MSPSILALVGPVAAMLLILAIRRIPSVLAIGGAVLGLAGAIVGLVDASAGGRAVLDLGGLPGLPLRLQHDPLTAVLSLTVAAVAFLVLVYAVGYMQDSSRSEQVRFFGHMAFFVTAMQALVLAADWLLLLASWELIGLASYLLIGFWYDRPRVPSAATRAFLTTRAADVGLYVAVFALTTCAGTTDLLTTLTASQGDLAIGLLLLVAAMGKAAQVPFHGWLQDAMLGPTPVSALLHSATLVAAGAILLIRTAPMFSDQTLLVIGFVGGLTILLTGLTALAQPDLKRLLAASTSSQLGFMFLALGAGSPVTALAHLVAHAAMKAALFVGAGVFQHRADSTAFADLRGLGRAYTQVFGLFALAGLALGGVPPLAGFWSKDAIEAATNQSRPALLLFPVALVGSGLTGAYVARTLRLLWFGSATPHPIVGVHWMVPPLAVLALLSAGLGVALEPMAQLLGQRLPADTPSRLMGLGAMLVGLAAGWSGLAERAIAPIGEWAASGFRLGKGWLDFAVHPALSLARASNRLDGQIYELNVAVGRLVIMIARQPITATDVAVEHAVAGVGTGGLRLAYALRRFDEVDLDGAIERLALGTSALATRARTLQSGFVSRELVVAACGAMAIFLLALMAH